MVPLFLYQSKRAICIHVIRIVDVITDRTLDPYSTILLSTNCLVTYFPDMVINYMEVFALSNVPHKSDLEYMFGKHTEICLVT